MFYSGWEFPTPQRIVADNNRQDTNYFVQDTCSRGVSLVHFLHPRARRGVSNNNNTLAASWREGGERVHLKSDVPIHPCSGVFYFEVEVRSVAGGGVVNSGSTHSVAAVGASTARGVGNCEPEVVVGIARQSLPPHALPGEHAHSVGLFTAQRMAYMNGRAEGEAVRFPPAARRRHGSGNNNYSCNYNNAGGAGEGQRVRGMRVGDTVGCIVNLIEGSVRFTYNGELLDIVCMLSHRMPRHGYYPVVGMFRLCPAASLRVVFPPLGNGASVPRSMMTAKTTTLPPLQQQQRQPLSSTTTASTPAAPPTAAAAAEPALGSESICVSGTTFSRQEARRTAAEYFVYDIDKYCEGIAEDIVRIHQQKTAVDIENENEEGGGCSCRDASIMEAIRKHLAARGMTRALSAFEKEQEELCCTSPLHEEKDLQGAEETQAVRSEDLSKKNSIKKTQRGGSHGSSRVQMKTTEVTDEEKEEESQIFVYSRHIQQLREDIDRGDMISSTRRVLEVGVISPVTREKLSSVLENVDLLPHDFWGIIFFAQRKDILFLLRATQLVEVTLDAMEKGLHVLLDHLRGAEDSNWGGHRNHNPTSGNEISMPAPITTAEFMELALNTLLEPFEEFSVVAKQYQHTSGEGVRTVDEAAFGMYDETMKSGDSRWPCEDLTAHLFFAGGKTLWNGPEAPVTLLVRRSVPNMPPPKLRHQRRIVQTLSMLLSHQRAVCARVKEQCHAAEAHEWVEKWLALINDAKGQYRARCWCLLLHAIEDFNGALEYRLLVWQRRHEEEMREAERGGGLSHNNNNNSTVTCKKERSCGRLFPSLRSAWRHVHAAAALEPLLNIVTKVFSDKLYRAAAAAQLTKMTPQNGTSFTFAKGPKRGVSFRCDFVDIDEEEEEPHSNGCHPQAEGASELGNTFIANNSSEKTKKMSCYNDDVRLSFVYMKSIFESIFA